MPSPDWREAAEYPDPNSTTATQWAWEFLRRNPAYREEFTIALAENNNDAILALGRKWGLTFGAVDPELRLPSLWVYVEDLSGTGQQVKITPAVAFANSTVEVLAPRHPAGDELFPDSSPSLAAPTWQPEHHNKLAIVFDLNRPIKAQLKQASDILNSGRTFPTIRQIERARGTKLSARERKLVLWSRKRHRRRALKGSTKLRFDKFQTYLRLLDAKTAGATMDQMVTTIIPPRSDKRKTAALWLKSAEKLRDSGYRDIAAASDR
jgi:hypothetical protein